VRLQEGDCREEAAGKPARGSRREWSQNNDHVVLSRYPRIGIVPTIPPCTVRTSVFTESTSPPPAVLL
jgi:hypothetical protein